MKSIRREILCNHLVLIVCTCIFITLNVLAHASTSYRYSGILQDYQEVNELVTINNRRKTDFKLYCKRHEDAVLQQYYEECELRPCLLPEFSYSSNTRCGSQYICLT